MSYDRRSETMEDEHKIASLLIHTPVTVATGRRLLIVSMTTLLSIFRGYRHRQGNLSRGHGS